MHATLAKVISLFNARTLLTGEYTQALRDINQAIKQARLATSAKAAPDTVAAEGEGTGEDRAIPRAGDTRRTPAAASESRRNTTSSISAIQRFIDHEALTLLIKDILKMAKTLRSFTIKIGELTAARTKTETKNTFRKGIKVIRLVELTLASLMRLSFTEKKRRKLIQDGFYEVGIDSALSTVNRPENFLARFQLVIAAKTSSTDDATFQQRIMELTFTLLKSRIVASFNSCPAPAL
ncbi:MAG: hypothetical protein A3E87_09150 [Gammaproteobacteria bacterium RIFCSPHIGHO2_12_FULL_35_23]|nr:MAG: hypothetical protein A3E87_09150 [Gammaproteobacteria bacterium RIFCSPHIGHO2_12_FULL_35_23]